MLCLSVSEGGRTASVARPLSYCYQIITGQARADPCTRRLDHGAAASASQRRPYCGKTLPGVIVTAGRLKQDPPGGILPERTPVRWKDPPGGSTYARWHGTETARPEQSAISAASRSTTPCRRHRGRKPMNRITYSLSASVRIWNWI